MWVGYIRSHHEYSSYTDSVSKVVVHESRFVLSVDHSHVYKTPRMTVSCGEHSGTSLEQRNPPYDLTYTSRGGGTIYNTPLQVVWFGSLDDAMRWAKDHLDIAVANGVRRLLEWMLWK